MICKLEAIPNLASRFHFLQLFSVGSIVLFARGLDHRSYFLQKFIKVVNMIFLLSDVNLKSTIICFSVLNIIIAINFKTAFVQNFIK